MVARDESYFPRSPIGAARLLDAGFAGFFGLEINFGCFLVKL